MKILKLETIGDNDIFYKITVEQPARHWFAFWDNNTIEVTYIGNQLGWYDATTGLAVKGLRMFEFLTAAVRAQMLNKVVADDKKKKPSLSIIKDED